MSVGGSSPSPLGGICIVTSRVTHALGLSGGRALFRSAMVIGRTCEASEHVLGRDIEQPPLTRVESKKQKKSSQVKSATELPATTQLTREHPKRASLLVCTLRNLNRE